MSSGTGPRLPEPDSEELRRLLPGAEVREAYRFLYERRTDPPTMAEWVERSQGVFGRTNSNTGRRLRDVRNAFVVATYRQQGTGVWVYQLERQLDAKLDAVAISPKLQTEVFTMKGRYCAMCGLGPADGTKLQIDHIVPREWGGKTELENLEPLCVPHNHGKKAFFSTYDNVGPIIRDAMHHGDPWTRIGELLKGFRVSGQPCPVELVFLVARETHKGDPLKRLRELRFVLGWSIVSRRKKKDGVTSVTYELTSPAPAWPEGGPAVAVLAYERDRKRRALGDR